VDMAWAGLIPGVGDTDQWTLKVSICESHGTIHRSRVGTLYTGKEPFCIHV
jgi:hypothetical protein